MIDENIFVNRFYLINTFGTIKIIYIKSYNTKYNCYGADVLWSNDVNTTHHMLIYDTILMSDIEDNLCKEIYPEEIDILVHRYKLIKIDDYFIV